MSLGHNPPKKKQSWGLPRKQHKKNRPVANPENNFCSNSFCHTSLSPWSPLSTRVSMKAFAGGANLLWRRVRGGAVGGAWDGPPKEWGGEWYGNCSKRVKTEAGDLRWPFQVQCAGVESFYSIYWVRGVVGGQLDAPCVGQITLGRNREVSIICGFSGHWHINLQWRGVKAIDSSDCTSYAGIWQVLP